MQRDPPLVMFITVFLSCNKFTDKPRESTRTAVIVHCRFHLCNKHRTNRRYDLLSLFPPFHKVQALLLLLNPISDYTKYITKSYLR